MQRYRRKGTREDWERIVDTLRRDEPQFARGLDRAVFLHAEVDRDYLLIVLDGDRGDVGWGKGSDLERRANAACEALYGVGLRVSWQPRSGPRVNVRLRGLA